MNGQHRVLTSSAHLQLLAQRASKPQVLCADVPLTRMPLSARLSARQRMSATMPPLVHGVSQEAGVALVRVHGRLC